jgi:hypothetical protein
MRGKRSPLAAGFRHGARCYRVSVLWCDAMRSQLDSVRQSA